jgi:hypothetical protein
MVHINVLRNQIKETAETLCYTKREKFGSDPHPLECAGCNYYYECDHETWTEAIMPWFSGY